MFNHYRGLITAGIVFTAVLGLGYGIYRLPSVLLADSFEIETVLIESSSPQGLGKAAFLLESAMTASSVYFYVRGPARPIQPLFVGEDPLGYASDGDVKMEQAVWSQDGSIVAVRAKVGETSGHNFSKFNGTFFVDAYDFKAHRTVGKGLALHQKSQTIKKLIHNRGGEGQVAVRQPYAEGKDISRNQADEYKR